jgi:predicted nucleic-acid-binding protein
MIGADTNVLIRLFVREEPQTGMAGAFFAARSPADPAYVSLVVMTEFAWVLKKKYKQSLDAIRSAIQSMLDSDDFVVEERDRVEWALASYTRARMDFSDLLIARSSEIAGAARTVTFDTDAAKDVPGMELLK